MGRVRERGGRRVKKGEDEPWEEVVGSETYWVLTSNELISVCAEASFSCTKNQQQSLYG